MSRDQQELWAAAAAACRAFAATLGTGEAADLDTATIRVDSLDELDGQQDGEPTADFLRRAARSVPCRLRTSPIHASEARASSLRLCGPELAVRREAAAAAAAIAALSTTIELPMDQASLLR